jgi:hypothetical protein
VGRTRCQPTTPTPPRAARAGSWACRVLRDCRQRRPSAAAPRWMKPQVARQHRRGLVAALSQQSVRTRRGVGLTRAAVHHWQGPAHQWTRGQTAPAHQGHHQRSRLPWAAHAGRLASRKAHPRVHPSGHWLAHPQAHPCQGARRSWQRRRQAPCQGEHPVGAREMQARARARARVQARVGVPARGRVQVADQLSAAAP